MSAPCCSCTVSLDPPPRRSLRRRALRAANVIVPGVVLAAMPKCPVCVAGYVALLSGCGISLAAAGALRWAVIGVCVAALGYAAIASARRFLAA